MRRTSLLPLLALVSLAVAAPGVSRADPGGVVMTLDIRIGCFGCGTYGPTGNTLSGFVHAGEGAIRTGATVTGSFTVTEPTGASCVVSGSATGTITTSDGYVAEFGWTRLGTTMLATVDGATVPGTFTIDSPVGNPCGGPVHVVSVLGGGGPMRGPGARGHITMHRFPQSFGAPLAGVKLWAAPVALNGQPWRCVDVNTGLTVTEGSTLRSPNPGVICDEPAPYLDTCSRVDAGGYHAEAGSGTVTVRSECSTVAAQTTIQVPLRWPGYSQSQRSYTAVTPWTCRVDESLADADETDYWVFCDINLA